MSHETCCEIYFLSFSQEFLVVFLSIYLFCNVNINKYLPIVFESFGGISDEAFDFTKKLFQSISIRISEPKCIVAKSFYEKNSCTLMRSLARSMISRFPEFSFV